MGSRMMHYAIGTLLMRRYGFSKEFLLGTIAPDVQKNMKVPKDASHFIERDKQGFGDIKLDNFARQYQDKWTDEFVQGYYCHLIADAVWLKGPINQYARQFPIGSTERQQFIDDHYHDFHSFNAILRDQFALVPPQFELHENYPIAEIDPHFLPELVADLREDFNDQRKPLKMITTAQIEAYLKQSQAAYEQTLKW